MPFLAFISRIENLGEEEGEKYYSSHGRGFSVRIQAMVSLDRPAPVKSPYDRDVVVCAAAGAADFAAAAGMGRRLRRPAPPNSRIESEDNLVTLAPSLSHKYDVARSKTREIQTIYCSTAGSFFNSSFIMRPLFSSRGKGGRK